MRTLVCTACGRFTSQYCDRCPFCKQRNLVMLDSYNASTLHSSSLMNYQRQGSNPLTSLLLVAGLAGGSAAVLYLFMHTDSDAYKQASSQRDSRLLGAAADKSQLPH